MLSLMEAEGFEFDHYAVVIIACMLAIYSISHFFDWQFHHLFIVLQKLNE